jgi:hypothetical protein
MCGTKTQMLRVSYENTYIIEMKSHVIEHYKYFSQKHIFSEFFSNIIIIPLFVKCKRFCLINVTTRT